MLPINRCIFYCKARHSHARAPVRKRKQKVRSKTYAMHWLLIGLLLGVLGVTSIYLFISGKWSLNNFKLHIQASRKVKLKSEKVNKTTPLQGQVLAQKKETRQRFEFYQLLPGMEVPIPDDNVANAYQPPKRIADPLLPKPLNLAKMPPLSEPSPSPSIPEKKLPPLKPSLKSNHKLVKVQTRLAAAQYLIQVGSYRTLTGAETLKFRLASHGFQPRIQKIETDDGIWFRVTLGPFPSETMALHQKNRLAKQQIRGILILQRQ